MVGHGYRRTAADYCVYFKRYPGEKFIILLLYVDDMLIVGQDRAQISKLKEELAESFEMKDLGQPSKSWGWRLLVTEKIEDCGCHKKDMLNGFLKGST